MTSKRIDVRERGRVRAGIDHKLAAMPFGGFLAHRAKAFDLSRIVKRKDPSQRAADRIEAARLIGNALRRYWMHRDTEYLPDGLAYVLASLRKHAPPLLKALEDHSEGSTETGIHFAVDVMSGGGVHLKPLHEALRAICRGLEGGQQTPLDEKLGSDHAELASARSLRLQALKGVNKLADPSGHVLAFELIEPFRLLYKMNPEGANKQSYAKFLTQVEGVFIDHAALTLSQVEELEPTAAQKAAQTRYRVKHKPNSIRWAVAEWKRG